MCKRCDTITRTGNTIVLETKFSKPDAGDIFNAATKTLADVDYDTMVGIGFSGALVVPELAKALKKNFLILRPVEDPVVRFFGLDKAPERYGVGKLGKKWLFVDDFTSTGGTRNVTQELIKLLMREYDFYSWFVGSYFYTTDEFEGCCWL